MKRKSRFEKPAGYALKKLERRAETEEKAALQKEIAQVKSGTANKATVRRMKQDMIAYYVGGGLVLLMVGAGFITLFFTIDAGDSHYSHFRHHRRLYVGIAFLLSGLFLFLKGILRYRKGKYWSEEAEAKISTISLAKETVPVSKPKPDFDAMVEKLQKGHDQIVLDDLYRQFFLLEEWNYIVANPQEYAHAKPFIGIIDEKPWVFVFTDRLKADAYARGVQGFTQHDGSVLILTMKVEGSLDYFRRIAEKGVYGVRVNEGNQGWFISIDGLLKMRAQLFSF